MQRTVLLGKPVVTGKDFCDRMRRTLPCTDGAKRRKAAFPRKTWEDIMAAGFAQYPVGKLLGAGTPTSPLLKSPEV
eukprot:11178972-Lingulodinium_polyedra.AAC.1